MNRKDNAEIYCPKCGYRPRPEDRWSCVPACGTSWNTFWTRGVCPGCARKWEVTQCPACIRKSPHESWYHYPQETPTEDRVKEEAPEGAT